jgi:hypothetical protein
MTMYSPTSLDGSQDLGTAVYMIEGEGDTETASLVEIAELVYEESCDDFGNSSLTPTLFVEPFLFPRYTDEVAAALGRALDRLNRNVDLRIYSLIIVPKRIPDNWRELRQQERLSGVNNQAAWAPKAKPHPVKDGLHFRDPSEVIVYDALQALQASRPQSDTISILPNAPVRVGGRTFIPDFVVTYRGRVGIIEVDGATHHGRYLADASKSELFVDAGYVLVYRIPAEDTSDPAAVRGHLDNFLARLIAR